MKKKIKIINYNHLNKFNKTKNELLVYDVPLSFKNPFNVSAKNSKVYINKSFIIANKLSIEKKSKALLIVQLIKGFFWSQSNWNYFGMYHDQVLSPMKTIFEYDAINITLGLPFLRISPDHGPNIQMIGKNKSNPLSLIRALQFLDKN